MKAKQTSVPVLLEFKLRKKEGDPCVEKHMSHVKEKERGRDYTSELNGYLSGILLSDMCQHKDDMCM